MTVARRCIPRPLKKQLVFASDTSIAIPSTRFAAGENSELTYTVTLFNNSIPQQIWATDTGNSFTSLGPGVTYSGSRASNNGSTEDVAWQVDTEYVVRELISVLQSYDIEVIMDGGLNPTGFVVIGNSGSETGPWEIGGGMVGIIKDFKLYNSSYTLIHHWPIDDLVGNGGEITDIVGGAHGTLTLGGGHWE